VWVPSGPNRTAVSFGGGIRGDARPRVSHIAYASGSSSNRLFSAAHFSKSPGRKGGRY